MRIIFVRHGEPDYARDCLTDEGRRQAAAAAERLAGEGISEIYASPCGRAMETARYTARRLGLPVVTLDYMHEIAWGGEGVPHGGHPWTLGDCMLAEGFDFSAGDWRAHPYFRDNVATEYYGRIAPQIDAFLAGFGYRARGAALPLRGRQGRDRRPVQPRRLRGLRAGPHAVAALPLRGLGAALRLHLDHHTGFPRERGPLRLSPRGAFQRLRPHPRRREKAGDSAGIGKPIIENPQL